MPNILLVGDIHPDGHRLLDRRPEYKRVSFADPRPADLHRVIADADAIILRKLNLGADTLDKAARLKVVSRHGVGCDNIDVDRLTRRGVPVTIVGDANSISVAEHAIMLLLAAARRLPASMALARSDDTPSERQSFLAARDAIGTMELSGRAVMIVGFGRIGRRLAKLADAFDMKIVIADPFVDPELPRSLGYHHLSHFEEALGIVDCIVLCLPAGPNGAPMFGASQFARMKEGSILVNVARGSLVDEDALASVVASGHLLGAGTDVWQSLPPGADHRLLAQPGVVATPHCAAHTNACLSRMATTSVQNVFDFFDGQLKPELCVNPETLSCSD